ncbi:MAG: PQQ-binding-like beta-propeller repeat protein [Bacteroidota bacterium]
MKIIRYSILLAALIGMLIPASAQNEIKQQWPQFRGYRGAGILDQAGTPITWSLGKKENILWDIPIPGLAHSSPVIWEDKIFLTTAVSSSRQDSLKIGLYGDTDMSQDQSIHDFKVYCIEKKSGNIIWENLACQGIPKERRHTKSTFANPTPATDGKYLVVSFGANGLYCYNLDGQLIWKKDLGKLATGPYDENGTEWGFSSSPVIYKDRIVVQADLLSNSFLAVYVLKTGDEIWRVNREEISSWGSPAIYEGKEKTQIILNGHPNMRSYDFETGSEIWKLSHVGDAPAPTAIVANDLIYLNNAHGKYQPIVAIRPTATGDLTLADTIMSSEHIAWMLKRGGAYMASLLVCGENLYNMQINGLLTVLDPLSGKVRYKQNIGKAFSASPVASDGKIYLTAETGEVYVLQDGPEYKLLAENNMGDPCIATPAISKGMLVFRTQHRLIAVGGE